MDTQTAKDVIAMVIGYHFWEAKTDDEAKRLGMDCANEVMESLEEEGLTFCPECGRRLRKKYY